MKYCYLLQYDYQSVQLKITTLEYPLVQDATGSAGQEAPEFADLRRYEGGWLLIL